jgi:hypothetical protein
MIVDRSAAFCFHATLTNRVRVIVSEICRAIQFVLWFYISPTARWHIGSAPRVEILNSLTHCSARHIAGQATERL